MTNLTDQQIVALALGALGFVLGALMLFALLAMRSQQRAMDRIWETEMRSTRVMLRALSEQERKRRAALTRTER